MRYENGAVGRLWASSINAGCMDSQRIRIVGSKASLVWTDANPSELRFEVQGQPNQTSTGACPTSTRAATPTSGWARSTPRA